MPTLIATALTCRTVGCAGAGPNSELDGSLQVSQLSTQDAQLLCYEMTEWVAASFDTGTWDEIGCHLVAEEGDLFQCIDIYDECRVEAPRGWARPSGGCTLQPEHFAGCGFSVDEVAECALQVIDTYATYREEHFCGTPKFRQFRDDGLSPRCKQVMTGDACTVIVLGVVEG